MPRIRSIKPEMPHDRKLAGVTRDARLTFVYCWTVADDQGLFRAHPRQLLGQLYPHDTDVDEGQLEAWCAELVAVGVLRWRWTLDGARVGEIVNWGKHQVIQKPGKPFLSKSLHPVGWEPPTNPPGTPEKKYVRSQESGVRSPESGVRSSVLRTEAAPRSDVSHLMGVLRETGYAPDRRPPEPGDPARDGSVFKALLKGGRSADDLADALRGVRAVADRRLPLPEGDTPWLAPFAKFTARFVYDTKWGSRPLADVARDVWRKGQARKDRGGPAEDVASILGRSA